MSSSRMFVDSATGEEIESAALARVPGEVDCLACGVLAMPLGCSPICHACDVGATVIALPECDSPMR